mmetsp:Transcript_14314/g.29118  ORF Transcript_14314/g.29118 Transcript_14314/m.29118 type:complete len:333 (-) Transcript_14314:132-1130(-)
MGGDGGTISSSRQYLRGAGKASHTADHPSNALKRAKVEDAERARLILSTCAISGTAFNFSPKSNSAGGGGIGTVSAAEIVACPFGKLYKREKALEALLQRSRAASGDVSTATLGPHIRGMKDLHPVRFHVVADSPSKDVNLKHKKYVPVCPITGSEIASGNVPLFLIVRLKKKGGGNSANVEVDEAPNVISERAIKEMGIAGLQSEYGPFDEKDIVRLAPPKTGGIFDEIQRNWEAKMAEESESKLRKKKYKKRKRIGDAFKSVSSVSASVTNGPNGTRGDEVRAKKSAADEARSSVHSAVAHSSVLSSLFGAGKKQQSEKEKRDGLFTRNC